MILLFTILDSVIPSRTPLLFKNLYYERSYMKLSTEQLRSLKKVTALGVEGIRNFARKILRVLEDAEQTRKLTEAEKNIRMQVDEVLK